MRIIIQDYAGHPFQVQLSRILAKRGWEVLHLYNASDITPRGEMNKKPDDVSSFDIIGITIPGGFKKYSFIQRYKQEKYYGDQVIGQIKAFKPDCILNANTPLTAYQQIDNFVKNTDVRQFFWMQDFYSVAAIKILSKKIPLIGYFIGKYFEHIEKKILKNSDEIILITKDFMPILRQWGIDENVISVIPNWSPIENLPARKKSVNNWALSSNYTETFNIFYTGTLAYKHNPDHLINISEAFSNFEDVKIVIFSEGKVVDELKEQISLLELTNIEILPFQPFEILSEVLSMADILLALLEDDAGMFSVPSKVLTYHCAQRPLLLIGPEDNLASRIINKNDSGLAVNSSKVDQGIQFLKELYRNKNRRAELGNNARNYAESNFKIDDIADRFEIILQRL
ncbi:MAG: glycosyltransferase family 4 protein [Reichenbachiella sp.]